MSKNLSELSGRKGWNKNLFEEIGLAAKGKGTPSAEAIATLAEEFVMGTANVYGAVSFYDFLRPENSNKKVYVCNGSACLTAGTQDELRKKLSHYFSEGEIGEMCCLGRCHENSAFHFGGMSFSGKAVETDFRSVAVTDAPLSVNDHYHVAGHGVQVLTGEFPGLEKYYESLSTALRSAPEVLLEELKISGLRGRGGAGFPIAYKLDACRKEVSNQKFIVCNADEGDPGAYSDRYLLEQQPHALLYGMIAAGFIAGATVGVIYIRGEYPEAIRITQQAVNDLVAAGYCGKNILDTGFNFEFKIIAAQGAYICGEETALLSSIEGQRPEVRVRPPYPVQHGLFNKPTVVNNVETLACIPFILEKGGKVFAAVGKGKSTGTKLISLDGFFNRPGICEVEMGTPLRYVVDDFGKGFKTDVKALHIGGPLGGLVPVGKIDSLTIDFESFAQNGFLLGHASVVCIPQSFPLIQYLEHLFQFTAHESCGKCFPCRLGATRGYELLQKAQSEDYKIDPLLFGDLLNTMEIGSLCALGGGLPLAMRNALQYFEEELSPYFQNS
ncbi:MAG: NAD(P)H-dependent oxidoreductase subunit E [Chitinophagales bacterium]|nr:NAD(P)H-dependent oxidoreductase subunit E [Chitinophagales bacterium]